MSLKASNYKVFARPPPRQLLHKVDGVLGDRSWGCRRADPHRTSGQPAGPSRVQRPRRQW
ncbi:hypothetical protein CO662_35895 [Rhizobium anhuiense]|uniref:Uncharacterized protein n=2 Tax=Rhizobium TaxID=379 RepID=A0A3S0QS03_9HYPH|nr:hypothetical protein CO665_33520 [Rhizobium anhuiense]PDS77279.1 hypothetical protein CO654_34425 [Rhizobium sp. L18]PDT26091.1 hypothetical protein CO660_29960 [Rhizobium sp. L9]PDV84820.1 hypothetical protein CO652_29995 [Rhizobium sp. H4]RUM01765.1 hypothetical protein EFR84_21995 [Rhizobium chutanense]